MCGASGHAVRAAHPGPPSDGAHVVAQQAAGISSERPPTWRIRAHDAAHARCRRAREPLAATFDETADRYQRARPEAYQAAGAEAALAHLRVVGEHALDVARFRAIVEWTTETAATVRR
jgi:hypothetical protein